MKKHIVMSIFATTLAAQVQAQKFPEKPIRLVSPFMKQGATPTVSSSPEAFDKMVHTEIATRRKVWLQAGVKPE